MSAVIYDLSYKPLNDPIWDNGTYHIGSDEYQCSLAGASAARKTLCLDVDEGSGKGDHLCLIHIRSAFFFLGHRQTLASVGRFVRPSYEMGIDARKVCEQHRRRPACASAQSDQRLCYSLIGKYYI